MVMKIMHHLREPTVVSHFASERIAIFGQKIQTETLPAGYLWVVLQELDGVFECCLIGIDVLEAVGVKIFLHLRTSLFG